MNRTVVDGRCMPGVYVRVCGVIAPVDYVEWIIYKAVVWSIEA